MSDYSCTVTYSNDEWEYKDWVISFDASATYIHEDMVMYYKDGTGHPGCDDIEDKDWTIKSVTDAEGNELELGQDNYPVSFTEEQKKELEGAIDSYLDDVDWDYPERNDWEPEFEED